MNDYWRLEQLFRDAWPALEEYEADGWLARLTGGDTRRPNSINPIRQDAGEVIAAVAEFSDAYRCKGLRQIVRVPDFCGAADAALATAGWTIEGKTRTLAASLGGRTMPAHPDIELAPAPSAEWITARVGPEGDSATEALIARIVVPTLFATVRKAGTVAAIGFVGIDAGYGVIESIRTMPDFRGQGLGTACVAALLAGAEQAGADIAALQVDASNVAGLALYARLGFDRHLYDYHYRIPV